MSSENRRLKSFELRTIRTITREIGVHGLNRSGLEFAKNIICTSQLVHSLEHACLEPSQLGESEYLKSFVRGSNLPIQMTKSLFVDRMSPILKHEWEFYYFPHKKTKDSFVAFIYLFLFLLFYLDVVIRRTSLQLMYWISAWIL